MKKQFIFLTKSDHPKGNEVFKRLTSQGFFTKENTVLFTENSEGKISQLAYHNSIEIYQIDNNKQMAAIMNNLHPEILISCGWHKKITKGVIESCSIKPINCHSSYLPDYKGLGAYKHAWSNGEEYSGATIHILDEDFDTGKILAQSKVKIFFWDLPSSILYRISEQTAILIQLAILKLYKGDFGKEQEKSGRYFIATSNKKHLILRVYNLIAPVIGFNKQITKFK